MTLKFRVVFYFINVPFYAFLLTFIPEANFLKATWTNQLRSVGLGLKGTSTPSPPQQRLQIADFVRNPVAGQTWEMLWSNGCCSSLL